MSKQASPTMIGAFVLGAMALVVVGILALGGGKFFERTRTMVAYFSGNVNGLAVGAPVKFRGVKLGEVTSISMIVDAGGGDGRIEVVMRVLQDVGRVINVPRGSARSDFAEFLVEKRGLRAKLSTESFVTGQLYVDLDFDPSVPGERAGLSKEYLEVPTIPSDMEQLRNTLADALAAIRKLPLADIAEDLRDTVASIRELTASGEIGDAVRNVNTTFVELQKLVANLDTQIAAADLDGMAAAASGALHSADATLATVTAALEPGSPLRYQLAEALQELASAARSIRVLADTIERNPRAVLFGKTGAEDE
jgi:paraquat-inducible protein B